MALFAVVVALAGAPGADYSAFTPAPPPREAGNRRSSCRTRACWRRVRDRRRRSWARRHPWEYRRNRIPASGRQWLRTTRQCESGGNYRINTGNGYYGAYQFSTGTWFGATGARLGLPDARVMPHRAKPAEQDVRAYRLMRRDGPGHWPVCG